MSSLRLGWCALLLAAPLCADAINVSADSSVALQPGDTLTFNISAWSYLVHASQYGAPADPSYLSFSLLTDPLLTSLNLAVSLQSYNGAVTAPIAGVTQSSGSFQGSLYQGPVSMESGAIALSPALSGQLFSGPALLLSVEDVGGSATLGLTPYTLLQSLEVSLSGGGFSVGGVVATATLSGAPQVSVMAEPLDNIGPLDTPEPASAPLLALGAACLLLATVAKRLHLKKTV
jgi:hypothetical protein